MELATCDKYYDKVIEKFPELTYKQLDKLVKHGLSSLYLYNLYGGDVLLTNGKYTMYFGKLFKDGLIFYKYWQIKWKIKLRIKYKKAKTKYSGYYYFGMTEKAFQEYKSKIKSTGRRREKFEFKYIQMFKILEECLLHKQYKHIFRIKYPEDCGFTMFKKNWVARDFDYIYKRDKDNNIEPISYEQKKRNKHVKRRAQQGPKPSCNAKFSAYR